MVVVVLWLEVGGDYETFDFITRKKDTFQMNEFVIVDGKKQLWILLNSIHEAEMKYTCWGLLGEYISLAMHLHL